MNDYNPKNQNDSADYSETDSCLNNYDNIAAFRKYKRDDFKSLVVQPILTNKLTDNLFVLCLL